MKYISPLTNKEYVFSQHTEESGGLTLEGVGKVVARDLILGKVYRIYDPFISLRGKEIKLKDHENLEVACSRLVYEYELNCGLVLCNTPIQPTPLTQNEDYYWATFSMDADAPYNTYLMRRNCEELPPTVGWVTHFNQASGLWHVTYFCEYNPTSRAAYGGNFSSPQEAATYLIAKGKQNIK